MAKNKEITIIKKGRSEFNLVGKALVKDFTIALDCESKNSDWVYNKMNLGVDCGTGIIYADMMGGYGSTRKNKVFVHGVKLNDNNKMIDDFDTRFEIDWEDRLDEELYETIGDRCFFTVGLEKDIKDKTVYKKFLSQYDAIQYIKEHLEDGMVVNVKGNLKYQLYNDSYTVKKEITSIVLSNAEEKDFKATFMQTILLTEDSIGKPDKETRTVPISAYVLDFAKEYDNKKIVRMVNGKEKVGCNIPLVKIFDIPVGDDKERVAKMLKLFKVKPRKVTEMVIDGLFTKGELNTVEVTEDDIPDDIKELIELELIDKEEVLGKIAFANGGNKPEKMMIKSPHIDMKDVDGGKKPTIAREVEKYTTDDLVIESIIEQLGFSLGASQDEESEDTEETLDNLLDEDSDDEEEDWLKDL